MITDVRIYDDFLPKEKFEEIKNLLCGDCLPWYLNNYTTYPNNPDKEDFQFTHTFYRDYVVTSDYFYILQPLIEKINPAAILRIKANLTTYNGKNYQYPFHVDIPNYSGKSAIYYINNNNGKTLFENGETIDSVENRLIIFDTTIRHTGYMSTDTKTRCLINLNFAEWNN